MLIVVGFVLVGWLTLRFAPSVLTQPADAVAVRPFQAGLFGLLAAAFFVVIPLAPVVQVLLMRLAMP